MPTRQPTMSTDSRTLRRADLAMDDATAWSVLTQGYSGRLGTVGTDGAPYVVPMLYVCDGPVVYLHSSLAMGRMRSNLEHECRVCFLVDEPGKVYPYGRFECDSSLSYRSVMAFGKVRIVDDEGKASGFFDALMAKYSPADTGRPRGYYPRIKQIVVYALDVERLTGKQIHLPVAAQQWPSIDRTMTPDVVGAPAPAPAQSRPMGIRGRCLCGKVKYLLGGEPVAMYYCHCGDCRRASGSSFAANVMVCASDFTFTEGEAMLSRFESSPAKHRYFCSGCGSPIFSQAAASKQFLSVRCGTLEDDPGVRPSGHAFVDFKAPWTELNDGLPRFPGPIR